MTWKKRRTKTLKVNFIFKLNKYNGVFKIKLNKNKIIECWSKFNRTENERARDDELRF